MPPTPQRGMTSSSPKMFTCDDTDRANRMLVARDCKQMTNCHQSEDDQLAGCALPRPGCRVHAQVKGRLQPLPVTPAFIAVTVNSPPRSHALTRPPGAQSGLVPTDARHVPGEQRRGRGAERDQEPAGEAGVHHEAGGQPVWTAERAQGAGASSSSSSSSVCF